MLACASGFASPATALARARDHDLEGRVPFAARSRTHAHFSNLHLKALKLRFEPG